MPQARGEVPGMSLQTKTVGLFFLLVLLFIGSMAGRAGAGQAGEVALDLYWISFGGSSNNDPVYIMQINQDGKVTKRPKKVLLASQIGTDNGATAIGKNGSTKLNLWVLGGAEVLYRAVLDKTTLGLLDLKETGVLASDDDALQVTQKRSANFLAIEIV